MTPDQQPTADEIRRLRNVWAAAYSNFDEFLKRDGVTITEIKSMLLGVSSEVFTTAAYMSGTPNYE